MRWLHLSDIHVGQPDQARSNAMQLLLGAIADRSGDNPIDLVFFTGDLAYSGRPEEYTSLHAELIEPLRRLDVTKRAQFIAVPGNHDLDCDCSHPIVWDMLGQSRQEQFWESNEHGISLRSARAHGFESFATFLDATGISGPNPTEQVGIRLDLDLPCGERVTVICLNTALFSDRHLSAEKEREASPLPVQALRSLANERQLATPTLVLGHHPLHWFERRSKQNFLSALRDLGAIYLHGHTHEIEDHFRSHALATLGFGAAYPGHIEHQSAPFTSTFAICQLEEELHMSFISWEPMHGIWRPSQDVPGDFSERSDVLPDGYRVPVPTTKSATLTRAAALHEVTTPLQLESPIWIDAPYVDHWAKLLALIGKVERQHEIIQQTLKSEVGGQASFILTDRDGRHGVRAFSAETTVITYEHVEGVNTELDTLQLDSYIVATLGKVSASAAALAANLGRKKKITVLDGQSLARELASTAVVKSLLSNHLEGHASLLARPLITPDGLAFLLLAAPVGDRYALLDHGGDLLGEHAPLARAVRERLPELAAIQYGLRVAGGEHAPQPPRPFDRDAYLRRCLSTYDTAKYAGLAAIGIRLPVESLRKIYVPTAANVQSDQAAMEATHRAIDDLVEALGLDEVQKMQLARQMKSTYGVRSTSEVDAASGLYQALSNIVVLGDPGSGKSCFVRAQIMAYCEPPSGEDANWYGQHVPVFLPLAEYSDVLGEEKPLLEHCVAHAQSQHLELDLPQLEILLSRGQIAFFLDGLDEIGSIAARQQVVAQVAQLLEDYAPIGNRFVMTSRPAAVRDLDLPPGFTNLSLQGLTDDEIRLLATRLFESRYAAGPPLPEQDLQVIDTVLRDCEAKPGIRRLARNPLLLTLLVFIYENSGPFAARRHLIYSQAVKTLVSVRHRDILRARLSEADLRTRLGRLAVAIFRRQVSPLPTRGEVASYLEGQLPLTHEALNQFVKDVAEITGLLMVHPRGADQEKDLVSFMHHSFLEYYTALGLLEEDAIIDEAFAHALTPRWSEIVTLMFGILGEQTDVTDRLKQLGKRQDESDMITAGRLTIAFDCALECDVPPEAAQVYLADEVHALMADGPGLYVSDVRDNLAEKIRTLLESSESKPMKSVLMDGVSAANPEVAGAYIHLVSKIGPYSNGSSEFVQALSNAFARDDHAVRLSLINAMRDLPALRTPKNLNVLRHVLERGGVVERTAALQLLEEEPTLIGSFRDQLADVLFRDNALSLTAASCVLRGGVYQQNGTTDHSLLDRALRTLTSNDGPRQSLLGRLSISPEELDSLLYSEHIRERCRGYRALVAIQDDPATVHSILFDSLRSESDNVVIVAILNALSSYPAAIRAASLADTDYVCQLTADPRQNVRTAAARALRSFAPLQTVTDSLKQRFDDLAGVHSKEADEVTKSLSTHAVDDHSCRRELVRQLTHLLQREQIRWNTKWTGIFSRLLLACDQAGAQLSPGLARRVIQLVGDFKTPDDIRRQAMRFYGQACPTTTAAGRSIANEFRAPDPGRRLAAYRSASRFLGRCRVRVETVRAVREALLEMSDEFVRAWHLEARSLVNKLDSPALREIRSCLLTIKSTLGSYDEFAGRVSASPLAS